MIAIKQATLSWLLEGDNQPVRYLAMRHLLDKSDSDEEVVAAKNEIMTYGPTDTILESRHIFLPGNDTNRDPYHYFDGLEWQVIFLGDFLATAADRRALECCEAVLKWQNQSGGFRPGFGYSGEIICLTSNIFRGFIVMGLHERPEVKKGLTFIAKRIIEHNGVPCKFVEDSIYPTCFMTAPRALRTFAAYPEYMRTPAMKEAMSILIEKIYENKISRYEHPKSKQFKKDLERFIEESGGSPSLEKKLAFKQKYINDNPAEELLQKEGWQAFSFPLHFNPNLLESVVSLIEAGDVRKDELEEASHIIIGKKDKNDRWLMDESLNGQMVVDIEEKGKPSKWITFYALYALKNTTDIRFE